MPLGDFSFLEHVGDRVLVGVADDEAVLPELHVPGSSTDHGGGERRGELGAGGCGSGCDADLRLRRRPEMGKEEAEEAPAVLGWRGALPRPPRLAGGSISGGSLKPGGS